MSKVLIVCNEASGDLHGANLIKEIKIKHPDIEFFAVGGKLMEAQGAKLIFDIKNMSVMGVVEVLKKLPTILRLFKKISLFCKRQSPKLVILIDAPDFNLRVAPKLKKLGIPVVYYISPTIWAWRYNRVNIIRKFVDKMLVILPFEADIYHKENIDAVFVGHPLLDELKDYLPEKPKLHPNINENLTIGILPGSRQFEVKLLFPAIIDACDILKERYPKLKVIVIKASTIKKSLLEEYIGSRDLEISSNKARQVFPLCDFAIVKSGTSTLEAGLLGIPMVIIYKFNWLNYFIGKYIVRINPQRFGLVNILAQKDIATEIFQGDVNGTTIANGVCKILDSPERYQKFTNELMDLKKSLTTEGPSRIAAREVEQFL